MEGHHRIQILLGVISPFLLIPLLYAIYYFFLKKSTWKRRRDDLIEEGGFKYAEEGELEAEDLIRFSGGENLTVHEILEAPGEVVGKSSYGTLYRASLQTNGSVVLLRFVRPACIGRTEDIFPVVRILGFIQHPNLVPLRALYVGPRGEKLFVHPFFAAGTLSQFLQDGNPESTTWEVIHKVSLGIAKGLDHLHTGLQKSIVHGNLKSKNILLDSDYQPRLSDFGLHLILNPTAGQEMLEGSAAQGYKAPELIKMKDASKESDIYSLGVVFLEMLTRKEPMKSNLSHSHDLHLPTSMRNLVFEHKVSDIFSSELLDQIKKTYNSTREEGLLMYYVLAMACCSPSPAFRPDIKYVIRKLEEIGQL